MLENWSFLAKPALRIQHKFLKRKFQTTPRIQRNITKHAIRARPKSQYTSNPLDTGCKLNILCTSNLIVAFKWKQQHKQKKESLQNKQNVLFGLVVILKVHSCRFENLSVCLCSYNNNSLKISCSYS